MNKLLVWGTGLIAAQVLKDGLAGEIVGFIETSKRKDIYYDKKVYFVDEVAANIAEYDYIVVANTYTAAIYDVCIEKEIPLNKVIFMKPVYRELGMADTEVLQKVLGEKNYTNYCAAYKKVSESFIVEDRKKYESLNKRENFAIQDEYLYPVIEDKYAAAGTIGNYFWQDLWAAKLILDSKVKEHFDIGSRLDGFIAHLLAAKLDVTMIDVREFPGEVEGLHTIVDDATTLHQVEDDSIMSLSALCSLEHFGLGRYGDPIDPEACFKCFANIQKKMKQGGHLYISVPIGKEKVHFNAHRCFYPQTIIDSFEQMKLLEFSCTAEGKIEYNVEIHKYDEAVDDGNYRYGLFHFIKM